MIERASRRKTEKKRSDAHLSKKEQILIMRDDVRKMFLKIRWILPTQDSESRTQENVGKTNAKPTKKKRTHAGGGGTGGRLNSKSSGEETPCYRHLTRRVKTGEACHGRPN